VRSETIKKQGTFGEKKTGNGPGEIAYAADHLNFFHERGAQVGRKKTTWESERSRAEEGEIMKDRTSGEERCRRGGCIEGHKRHVSWREGGGILTKQRPNTKTPKKKKNKKTTQKNGAEEE